MPTDRHLPNTPTVAAHADAVRTQLQYYLAMGAVERCARSDIAAVHPLHCVVRPDKKLRIVVDFSLNLNDYLTVPQMRYASSIDAAVAASHPGCYYSKLDIKDAFLSFSMRSGAERLLGFHFEGQFYRYRRLPERQHRSRAVRAHALRRVMAAHPARREARAVLRRHPHHRIDTR